jgi:geranylgeranylglycerol-phosphate geranylgeranyltransferase
MDKIGGFLHLMRPANCLMMGFGVIVGAALANRSFLTDHWSSLIYGFVTGFALTAASMAINDYYDREIDVSNEPARPIPSGLVKPEQSLAFAVILTAVGFAAALLTNIYCILVAIIAWLIFVTYTTIGKRSGLPGNFLVSTVVAVPFIYGNYTVGSQIRLNILIFASMAFLSNTGREITKGIVDVKGDEAHNVKTLAVRYGDRKAAVAAAFFYLFAVSLSPIPWVLMSVSIWFIPLVVVTDLGLVASSFMLVRDFSRENARKVKRTVLLWLLVGLLGFFVGSLG